MSTGTPGSTDQVHHRPGRIELILADRRADLVRYHAVDPDLVGRELHRHGAREVRDPALGGRVRDRARAAEEARCGAHIDDLAAGALAIRNRRPPPPPPPPPPRLAKTFSPIAVPVMRSRFGNRSAGRVRPWR